MAVTTPPRCGSIAFAGDVHEHREVGDHGEQTASQDDRLAADARMGGIPLHPLDGSNVCAIIESIVRISDERAQKSVPGWRGNEL